MYSVNDVESRIASDSAKHVECIHTGFWLGTRESFCQVEFYVNGGTRQPDCKDSFGHDNVACSHFKAVEMYIKSIESPKSVKGTKCENLQRAIMKSCRSEEIAYFNDKESAANDLKGIYHISTR